MLNNPGVMGQPIPPNANQLQASGQTQQPPGMTQMMSGGPAQPISMQARLTKNEEMLSRCLTQTQRLRENLQSLLNATKQAANIEAEEQASTSSSSTATAITMGGATTYAGTNSVLRNSIDRKLCEMSASLDQLHALLDQYDFKFVFSQHALTNHYNELSYEKQGTLVDEWSSNMRWMDKLNEIAPFVQANAHTYRRSNYKSLSLNTRLRSETPSSLLIDRAVSNFETLYGQQQQQQQQQQSPSKDYVINIQRLSDHLHIVELCLLRSGLDVYLYVRHATVEHVVVKPLNEKKLFPNNFNSKLSSNYGALDIVAGHMRAVAVHFSQISSAEQALSKLLIHIAKYQSLHAQKCSKCQKHLINGLQPTWRDLKTIDAVHEECLA